MESCTDHLNLNISLFVVIEYAYLIPEKCLFFIFAYMALVKYLPIFTMARHYEHWNH